MSNGPDDTPQDRRSLFRHGLKRLLTPLADVIEQKLEPRLNIPLPISRVVLRPPGALPERAFLSTCYRCGNCVDVCPAKAIRPRTDDEGDQRGTPYIDADLAACVVCDELACMRACPSGALRMVDSPRSIKMGMARVDNWMCVRSRQEDCRTCVERCPFGEEAIRLDSEGKVEVLSGCVGCGVCQFYCPTVPKSIRVDPL